MATPPTPQSLPPRRKTEPEIASAIDLGWRLAALHGLSTSTLAPPAAEHDDLLLNRLSLPAVDRLELELEAIAGTAERIGVPLAGADLKALIDLAPAAAQSLDGEERFRAALARTHIAFEKQLWARDEPRGRAYELGNFLSDTWNRMLRPRTTLTPQDELLEIFSSERVRRIRVLLDNLQTRLDPAAVHAVTNHLGVWHARVAAQPRRSAGDAAAAAAAPALADVVKTYEPVERQTIIWRQLLTGDKDAEAYIDHAHRAQARDELAQQIWRRYRSKAWLLIPAGLIGGAIGYLLVSDSSLAAGAIGTLTAVGGMVGVTRASMLASVKRGLQNWGELMWNRSLAEVICRQTLVVDDLLPAPDGPAAAK